ncbi:hypothetical protein [Fischerella sp. PCC 9605]|uniref:hypothetical protein n=1 Tax=Fischerella sp. PCC 9605 TaxID=1173024 RepID=UPI0018CC0E3E|nr:hypothetical protein [Fischerella sp. PCC 9605]
MNCLPPCPYECPASKIQSQYGSAIAFQALQCDRSVSLNNQTFNASQTTTHT